ncbi:hypothetical protein HPP92_008652 [Vanilla planifolia]|uniref:VOC domain-containing protein n=1 Tax=Vanilla planifolia TaxID=51239 RepID=A0A835R6H2_VANPL|nr:hypothetical protein HPP92_008652 [Vanilla planifolia]
MGAPMRASGPLPLKSLNHISRLCRCLHTSLHFYQNILGFHRIKRPESIDIAGVWLFNYGYGIHLLQLENHESVSGKTAINPEDNHISFLCESMGVVEKRLKEMGVSYVRRRVEECGINVEQVFFHDPDGFMINVCSFELPTRSEMEQ